MGQIPGLQLQRKMTICSQETWNPAVKETLRGSISAKKQLADNSSSG